MSVQNADLGGSPRWSLVGGNGNGVGGLGVCEGDCDSDETAESV